MTPKEALKWLDEHNTSSVIPLEVKVLCLKALEKQIPKKPINVKSMATDLKYGVCPKCGEGANDEMAYCSMCGTRLDWSEEE